MRGHGEENMTKKKFVPDKPEPSASFTWGSIVNLGGIPLITAVFFVVGNYFVNGERLNKVETALKDVSTSREDERKSRENVRNEFLLSQAKLVEVLGRLDTRLSVSEKQQEVTSRQLEKINDLLQSRPGAVKR